jgi:hypothetical protein
MPMRAYAELITAHIATLFFVSMTLDEVSSSGTGAGSNHSAFLPAE